jgi:hypothetical protein
MKRSITFLVAAVLLCSAAIATAKAVPPQVVVASDGRCPQVVVDNDGFRFPVILWMPTGQFVIL